MKKNVLFISLLLSLTLMPVWAQRPVQEHTPWDIRLTGTAGWALLPSSASYDISSTPGNVYGGGIQIDYLIQNYFGAGMGFEYHRTTSSMVLSNYSATLPGTLSSGANSVPQNVEYQIITNGTDVVDYVEMSSFDIPIYGYYKVPVRSNTFLDFRGGIQFSVQTKGTFTLQSGDITTRLYNIDTDQLVMNNPQQGLFENRTDWHPVRNVNTPFINSAFAAAGLDFPFLRILQLRVSGYLSYSLGQVYKQREDALITRPNTYNGILSLTDKNYLFTYGFKFALGWNKYPKAAPMRGTEYNCAGCAWVKKENTYRSRRR